MNEMDFLKRKFFDNDNLIEEYLLTQSGALNPLEYLPEPIKKGFRDNFFKGLKATEAVGFKEETYNVVDEATNPWSIDFPSWIGPFDPKSGKKVFVIGSEPHIGHRYLQTVYGFYTEEGKSLHDLSRSYFGRTYSIFHFIPQILSPVLRIPEAEVLLHCYLTDLVPFAPMKSRDTKVGSTFKIADLIKGTGDWLNIRKEYASVALADEIKGVKPEIIVTQGKEVFYEVCKVLLDNKFEEKHFPVKKLKGRQQYVRMAKYGNIPILSVPHIGSKRMQTFWKLHINEVQSTVNECLNTLM
jgi:hypothetical protein